MKKYFSFEDALDFFETTEAPKYLWNGVVENTFGLIFGPPKSGKTIFCENLAISIALGRNEFMGYRLSSEPKKVLFIGLEEFFRNRIDRNIKQFSSLDNDEKELFKQNYMVIGQDYPREITTEENWEYLSSTIKESEAEVVFIDSITRLNHGKIEDSKIAEEICLKLRNLTEDLGITLIAIHHTPKLNDAEISRDKIKGSSVFSQETEFAIGINRNQKNIRYMRNIYFRYADDSDDSLHEFSLNENLIVNQMGTKTLEEVKFSNDRRTSDKRDLILGHFNSKPSTTFKTKEILVEISNEFDLKDRQIKEYLSELVASGKLLTPKRGNYCSVLNKEGGNIE